MSQIKINDLSPRPDEGIEVKKNLLGEGGFGSVYRAMYRGQPAAVKIIFQRGLPESAKEQIRKECLIMSTIHHPNIAQLYGYSLEGENSCLIMELAELGSLYDVLHNLTKYPHLTWKIRVSISLDIAQGLKILHSHDPPIIHRDLKSLNALLRKNWSAFLTDFGLSKVKAHSQSVGTKNIGSFPWMAPEMYDDDIVTTTSSDIYSFGMILFEILTREIPFVGLGQMKVFGMINRGQRPEIPTVEKNPFVADCPEGYFELIKDCWSQDGKVRPSADECVARLLKIQSQIAEAEKKQLGGCKKHSIKAHDIYISYRSKSEKSLAREIFKDLSIQKRSDNIPVVPFLDQFCLHEGETWEQAILNGLSHASLILLLISDSSLELIQNATEIQDPLLLEYEIALNKYEKKEVLIFPLYINSEKIENEKEVIVPFNGYETNFPDANHKVSLPYEGKNIQSTMKKLLKIPGLRINKHYDDSIIEVILKNLELIVQQLGRLTNNNINNEEKKGTPPSDFLSQIPPPYALSSLPAPSSSSSSVSSPVSSSLVTSTWETIPVASWKRHHVDQWLNDSGLGEHIEAFKEHSVEGVDLLDLTEEELIESLKITKVLQKKKILRFINEHKSKSQTQSQSTQSTSSPTHERKEEKKFNSTYSEPDSGLLQPEPTPVKALVLPKVTGGIKPKPSSFSKTKLSKAALERFFNHQLPDYAKQSFDEKFFNQQVKLEINKLTSLIQANISNSGESKLGEIYMGIGGIALTYLHLHLQDNKEKKYLKIGGEYLAQSQKLIEKSKEQPVTFLMGHGGLYALQAVYARANGQPDEQYIEALKGLNKKALKMRENELLYGRVGYLYAVQFVNYHLGKDTIPASSMSDIIAQIFADGQKIGSELGCGDALLWTFASQLYLGAAHGGIGILLILLSFPLTDAQYERIWYTLDWMIRDPRQMCRFQSGNWATILEETDKSMDYLVHWCHGATGMIFLLTKAYEVSRNRPQDKKRISPDLLLKEAEAASDLVWERGLLRKGLGLCHGIAGNCYSFLNLYKVTNNPKYLYRARAFAAFAMDHWEALTQAREMRIPDHPFSLFEGMAGMVCFYSDLIANSLLPPCFPGYEL